MNHSTQKCNLEDRYSEYRPINAQEYLHTLHVRSDKPQVLPGGDGGGGSGEGVYPSDGAGTDAGGVDITDEAPELSKISAGGGGIEVILLSDFSSLSSSTNGKQ